MEKEKLKQLGLHFCILIPAFNEEKAIVEIIRYIRTYGLDVIVIDDGSTDNTAEEARKINAVVFSHERNRGKGQALRTGFEHVIRNGYDGVILMDADGQHSPWGVKDFLEHAAGSKADIIIGNRMGHPEGMPLTRRWTNIFTSFVISKLARQRIPDSQCGFRLIRSGVLKKISLSTFKYDTDSEMLIEAARKGFRIESIPILSIYAGQESQINPLIDTFRFFGLIFRKYFVKR